MMTMLSMVLLAWSLFAALILVPFGALMNYAERKAKRKEDDNA